MTYIDERFNFFKKCFELRPEIRFQNIKIGQKHVLFSQIPSFAWMKNKEFLRYSLENSNITELIYDIDTKNEKGEKKLNLAINEGLKIYDKLKSAGLKPSFYYSGGSGVHIHTLIDINSLDFLRYKNINIDLKQYENEFRLSNEEKKNNKTPNIDLINLRNDERSLVKKWISEFFEIRDLVDSMLFSTKEMITAEGYNKRESKTGYYKIWINLEDLHRERRREEEIKRYIQENKEKIIINENYFNEISILNSDLVEFLKEQYKAHNSKNQEEREPIKEQKNNCEEYISYQTERGELKKENPTKISQYLVTFAYIWKKKNISSTNKYYNIVIAYLYSATGFNYDDTLNWFNKLFDVFGVKDNLTCSREEKVKGVIEQKKKYSIYAIFTENEYLTKDEFHNVYYNLFPKKNKSLSGLNDFSNNELNTQEVNS